MFALRRIGIDTHHEHVVMIHERAVEEGSLGFKPLDRVRVIGSDPESAIAIPERDLLVVASEDAGTLTIIGHTARSN